MQRRLCPEWEQLPYIRSGTLIPMKDSVRAKAIRAASTSFSNVGRVESSVQSDETRRQKIEQRNTCPTIAELG
jgi:hypothetical protein